MLSRRLTLLLPLLLLLTLSVRAAEDEARGFLPKDDLGVTTLQEAIPEADGRGVLVAVLDTGVDLLHPALRQNPDGSRKVVDFFDGTDAGEVETTAMASPSPDGIVGLSGRRLLLPDGLPDKLRLGLVRSRDLYPGRLLHRLRRERRERIDKEHAAAVARAPAGEAPPRPADPGDPLHDLVLSCGAGGWRLLIDTDGDGDLAEETAIREYPVAQDVVALGERTRLGVGFRVLREGRAVSLLFDGGGHGTHVAGIIAGYHGEGSPLNGLAPGASILAAKIGNGRYGGATTHLAMLRALTWAGERGADVVNISFGGESLFSDGREVSAKFIDDAVRKYGYAVCVSAGNAGPAYGTVGSPATARRAFTIGAWCSAATQTSNYGVVDPPGGRLFGFSSRGPLPDGRPGVDFIGPGAAVSSVPEWSLAAGRNMNGTSMAAPQASGAVAALLSAARREELPANWPRLATALRRSARPAPGLPVVEQGYGLVDALGALEALREMKDAADPVDWIAECRRFRDVAGDEPIPLELSLRPDFPDGATAEAKARFERLFRVVSDAPWLVPASPVHANADGATVRAVLSPEALPEGLSSAVLRVEDLATGAEAARHVVTAIRPIAVPRCGRFFRESFALRRGDRRSVFLRVPPGASLARVEARETAEDDGTRIVLRSADFRVEESGLALAGGAGPDAGRTTVLQRNVREGGVLEIVVERPFRAPAGVTEVEVGACFRGVSAGEREVVVPRGRFGTHLNLRAGGRVRLRVEGRLEWSEEPLDLAWKTERDPDAPVLLGAETMFRHVGRTDFRIPADKGQVRIDLGFETPFEDYLDDAVYAIEDANGRVVQKGHFWRGPFDFRPPHRGRFTIVLTIWERGRKAFRNGAIFSPVLLRKIRERRIRVRRDIYDGVLPGGPSGPRLSLADGERTAVILTRPDGGGTARGTIRLVEEDWGADLAKLPLRVEPPDLPEPEAALREGFVEMVDAEIDDALDRDELPKDALGRLRGLVDLVRTAGIPDPRREAHMLLLEGRHDDRAAALAGLDALEAELSGKKDQAAALDLLHRVRAELRAAAGDVEGAGKDLRAIRGNDEGARRARFLVARAKGDAKGALRELDALLKTAPPRPSLLRARFDLLLETKDLAGARRLLAEWTERLPRARYGEVREMALALEAASK